MLLNCGSVEEGAPTTSAPSRGIGTSDDENGDAPGEYGTLGLLLLLVTPPVNDVVNEPVKKRLVSEALEVMDMTWPLRPLNGGADHEFDLEFQTATEGPGEEK